MKKPFFGKDTLVLSIISLATIIVWIGFDIFQTFSQSQIPAATQKQLQPLDPVVSKKTLEQLEDQLSFSQEELDLVTTILEPETGEDELIKAIEAENLKEATDSGLASTSSGTLE